ncbi:MoaD/ThiS family protein [Deferribacter thermophilus]|uniref:MoaD/ThiS family protein n=1 Tax=Deferribacter thermophilus TaxID=53573 RepID=UPI003C1E8017
MVIVEFSNGEIKEVEVNKVRDLYKILNLRENSVLITRGDELLTEDDILNDGDKVKIISVVSGG